MRAAGCDLGKASVSLVLLDVPDSGDPTVVKTWTEAHEGKPFEVLARLYAEHHLAGFAALGATGIYADELSDPVHVLPEEACLTAALDFDKALPETLNLLSIGGRGYRALTRRVFGENGSRQARVRYLESDKCSSGTGENAQRMAARFGLSLAEADTLALAAQGTCAITARCSVFAKSEMTHHANEGKSSGELFRGYFDSVARNARALLARCEINGPVYLIGGCTRLESLRRSLSERVGRPVHVPEHALCFEAVGAALLAARATRENSARALPRELASLVRTREKRFTVLEPASRHSHRVRQLSAPAAATSFTGEPTVLGLDLGSTGAKAVLTSVATGEIVFDAYDRTRGNPIAATQRLVQTILSAGRPDVRAIGITGSGRQAVATLLRAVYGEADGRIAVLNEIVAHATAAIRCDPNRGADLSIIEIGGQDAKYIRVSGSRIIESDMNKACSAGTGSFLEEQAAFYDVKDIGEFTRLAKASTRPPDLGQMCTVFVAEAASEALKDGFELGDLFAGFQYSIIHNYLHRVMGQRTLAPTVFFQGKPATNPSLGWTLAAVTGRDIVVPPNPGAMGAWGIGLCAVDGCGASALLGSSRLELDRALAAQIVGRAEFTCQDKGCGTHCPIERTTVKVGDRQEVAVSGGACPKYELASRDSPKLPKDAPNPFEERAALLAPFRRHARSPHGVAVPETSAVHGYLPWVVTLLDELGLAPQVLMGDMGSLAAGEQLCNSFDSCGPAKIAYSVCDTDAPYLFFPKIVANADPEGVWGESCATEQSMPDLVQASLASRGRTTTVLKPVLWLGKSLDGPKVVEALGEVADKLRIPRSKLPAAVAKAASAQRAHERQLLEIGRRALAWARANKVPSVLVCGVQHVVHDGVINATIPQIVRRNGAMSLPIDCYPVPGDRPTMPKIYWGEPKRFLRAAALCREQGDVFPLLISSFGCGPASFTEQSFSEILEGYPHTILESDGHGGSAGFVTRIQSFLRSVRQHQSEGSTRELPDNRKALSHVEATPRTGGYLDKRVRYVFLNSVEYLGEIFAAAYRSAGYDAHVADPLDAGSLACGRHDCSGKECNSYQLIWGGFRQWLEKNPSDKPTRLIQIAMQLCRAGVFPVKDRISLERMGLGDQVTVSSIKLVGGAALTARVWSGLTASDLVKQLYLYNLAAESRPGEAAEIYHRHNKAIVSLMEEPAERGWIAGPSYLSRQWRRLEGLVEECAREFAELNGRRNPKRSLRVVFNSGDLLTKSNDFANSGLHRFLAKKGLRVLFEPTTDFIEYLVRERPWTMFGSGATRSSQLAYRVVLSRIRERLYSVASKRHPWLPRPAVPEAVARTARIIVPETNVGAPFTVGNVLLRWERDRIDGVVMSSCWGCDSGLIEESLLRHFDEIPLYFHYDDASPLDERKLAGFAFRLHQAPARGESEPQRTTLLPGLRRPAARTPEIGRRTSA